MKKKIVQPKEESNTYVVMAKLSSFSLGKSENSFKITCGKIVLGTLKISRGSIKWYAKKKSTPTCKLNWKQFADLMEN